MPLPQKTMPANHPTQAQQEHTAPAARHTTAKPSITNIETAKKPQVVSSAPKAMRDVAIKSQPKSSHPNATQMHQRTQRSLTLHPAARKRPAIQDNIASPVAKRSPAISRFAPEPASAAAPSQQPISPQGADRPTPVHPAVARAISDMAAQRPATTAPAKTTQPQTSKELKEALIKERLAEVEQTNSDKQPKQRRFFARQPKLTAILTSTLAILLLGGYFTYINLPNISMRVAATRAGVAANFPGYHPDGYSFAGPITYAPGEVAIEFKSNTNNSNFTIKEKNSSWDSQAVLDNYVAKQTDTYLTYQEGGLTIYSFGNKAAWVNGGLLYSVEGSASLSSEQLIRLATSM